MPENSNKKNKYYGLAAQKDDVLDDDMDILVIQLTKKQEEYQKNRWDIFLKTILQAECNLWKTIREEMLTSSNYGMVCKARDTTLCAKKVIAILNKTQKRGKVLAPLQYGKDHEKLALYDLSKLLKVTIKKCGLMIDSEHPFLGASPDGMIDADLSSLKIPSERIMNYDDSFVIKDHEVKGIVEVKCPISAAGVSTEEQLRRVPSVKEMFDKNNPNALNKNYDYYYQVQGALRHMKACYNIFLFGLRM